MPFNSSPILTTRVSFLKFKSDPITRFPVSYQINSELLNMVYEDLHDRNLFIDVPHYYPVILDIGLLKAGKEKGSFNS